MKNKSKVYGWYGGVKNKDHYTPPPSKPFVPYLDYDQAVSTFLSSVQQTKQFLQQNDGSILRRYMIDRENEQETYVIVNPIDSTDVITYTTSLSGDENLTDLDGGFF